jgi:competence protein ComEA
LRKEPAGTLLLVILLLFFYSFSLSRMVHHHDEPPAFFVENPREITIELGEGFSAPGIHQFSDGSLLETVIQLTSVPREMIDVGKLSMQTPLRSGWRFDLFEKRLGKQVLGLSWMRAAKRIAVGIPLHPDCMSLQDWEDLPGIGPRLAEKIEANRQNNGDFYSLNTLQRVKGIGEKRVSSWRAVFGDN